MHDAGERKQKPRNQGADRMRRDFADARLMLTRTDGWLNARVIAEIAASNALARESRATFESTRAAPQQNLGDGPWAASAITGLKDEKDGARRRPGTDSERDRR